MDVTLQGEVDHSTVFNNIITSSPSHSQLSPVTCDIPSSVDVTLQREIDNTTLIADIKTKRIFAMSSLSPKSAITISIRLHDRFFCFLVDSGAEISTIRPLIAKSISLEFQKHEDGGTLTFADKSTMDRSFFVSPDISFQGFAFNFNFDILDTTTAHDGLCGRDLMFALNATIHFPLFSEPLHPSEADILFPSHLPLRLKNLESEIFTSVKHLLDTNTSLLGFCNHPALPVKLPMVVSPSQTYSKTFRVSEEVRILQDKWLADSILAGIVIPCPINLHDVNFNNNIFPVWQLDKFTGKKLVDIPPRMVLNPKDINASLIVDRFPIPNIIDMRNRLAKYTYFFELDLTKAFNQFPLAQEDQYKSAFVIGNSRFMFRVLQFGFANGSAIFQKIISDIFKHLDNVFIYVDNILVGAYDLTHIQTSLSQVLSLLNSFNLKINISKSTLIATTINVLGAAISFGEIKPTSQMIQEAKDLPYPVSSKALHSCLGFAGFMRPFIPNFASIVAPLESLLIKSKGAPLSHYRTLSSSSECITAFNNLMIALASPLTLNSILPHLELSLICDASDTGIAAILFQPRGSSPNTPSADNIVGVFTQKLTGAQVNYHVCKKELLAIVSAIKHWDYLLWGNHFHVFCDSQALTWSNSPQNKITNQWFEYLLGFHFDIVHIPGVDNTLADFLSRLSPKPLTISQAIHSVMLAGDTPLTSEKSIMAIKQSKESKPLIPSAILYFVCLTTNSPKFYRVVWEGFSIYDTSWESRTFHFDASYLEQVPSAKSFFEHNFSDVNYFYIDKRPATLNDPFNGHADSYIYPDTETFDYSVASIANLIRQEHNRGHWASEIMHRNLTTAGFSWRNMLNDLKAYHKACTICNTHNPIARLFHELHSPDSKGPWEKIQMDLLTSFEISTAKFRYLLTIIDVFTKITFAFALVTKDAIEVVIHLKSLVLTFGIPRHCTSDGGGEFDNVLLSKIFHNLSVEHHISIPYAFRGHGLVESMNKTLFMVIKKYCLGDTTSWHLHIPAALLVINLKVHKHTSLSAFQLFFNRNFSHHGHSDITLANTQEDIDKWITILTDSSNKLIPLVHEAVIKKQKVANETFRKSHRMVKQDQFVLNDTVFIKSLNRNKKSEEICKGPFKIVQIYENGSYGLAQGDILHERKVPTNELKRATASDVTGTTINVAKAIMEKVGTASRTSYKVLWADDSFSWEPESNILDKALITKFHKAIRGT